jgi:predicted RNA-binding Zn-ribbon protein involved in translation (DUF1610 family)
MPYWMLASAALLPAPFAARRIWRRRRARRRAAAKLCPACGYDLRVQLALSEGSGSNGRASPGRCPECGAEPAGA